MASTPTADGDSRLSSKVIRPLAELERDAILEAVDCCGAEQAAKLLGIGTTTLYRKHLLYSAAALASQSHDARTVLVIPLERVRVLSMRLTAPRKCSYVVRKKRHHFWRKASASRLKAFAKSSRN
jgi:hypothetical protein